MVLTPLGAVVFAGIGRHPIAGLAAAFAGVSGGFSANLLFTSLDPLLSGLTEPAAQFVAYISWSNLGIILAVNGAELLKALGISGVPLLIGFIIVSAFLNLFIGSASAKWAIMAPVFVPMLMLMGYSPETVQAAYRVGDSVTNIITPLLPYCPIVIAFAKKYDPTVGLGTLISAMLPYSVAFFLAWSVLFIAWTAVGLPLGPDAPLTYPPSP